ncbi:MAG: hypothetical protein WKG07_22325 [Hymenobacter sp.]
MPSFTAPSRPRHLRAKWPGYPQRPDRPGRHTHQHARRPGAAAQPAGGRRAYRRAAPAPSHAGGPSRGRRRRLQQLSQSQGLSPEATTHLDTPAYLRRG